MQMTLAPIEDDRPETRAQKDKRELEAEQFRKSQEILARSHGQAERRIAQMRRTYFQLRYPDDWREQMVAAEERDQAHA